MKPSLHIVRPDPSLKDLAKYKLVYLATPYSKYPGGIEKAFKDATKLAARLVTAGVRVYPPITLTHPLAIIGGIDPMSHEIWLPFDQAMMDASEAIIVARMESWQISKGIAHEIEYFGGAGKPVFYLNPETMEVDR
jgi:hypothetical protein